MKYNCTIIWFKQKNLKTKINRTITKMEYLEDVTFDLARGYIGAELDCGFLFKDKNNNPCFLKDAYKAICDNQLSQIAKLVATPPITGNEVTVNI